MAKLVSEIRAPHEKLLSTALANNESLLYRRGNFNGTLDDLLCRAMLSERDAEVSLSPGFRWGNSLLPGNPFTWEDLYAATAVTYPSCYRISMKGETIKAILEDVADNLFNADPYHQQGGDMVRVGGLGYTIDIEAPIGQRISDMAHLKTDKPIEAEREYVVAGWASVNEGVEGPPIWDVVAAHLRNERVIKIAQSNSVKIRGAT
jgi:sulfur-oxidizing protein SoxB